MERNSAAHVSGKNLAPSTIEPTAPATFSLLAPVYAKKCGVEEDQLKQALTQNGAKNHGISRSHRGPRVPGLRQAYDASAAARRACLDKALAEANAMDAPRQGRLAQVQLELTLERQPMGTTINDKELRASLPKLVARVHKGARFVVIYRSRPAFQIVPIDDSEAPRTPLEGDPAYRAEPVGRSTDGRTAADHDDVLYGR